MYNTLLFSLSEQRGVATHFFLASAMGADPPNSGSLLLGGL